MGPDGRPGPSPFKPEGNVFERVPGCTPERIKPDLVHTFHIGFGADLAASMIVWMAKMNKFGRLSFDDKLRVAYSMFQEYCHHTKRYTACDEWCMKKFSMSSFLGISFLGYVCVFPFFLPLSSGSLKNPRENQFKKSHSSGSMTSRRVWPARVTILGWFAGGWKNYFVKT